MMDAEVFFNNVSTYNVSIFPMQIITLVVAIILTYLLFVRPSTILNKLMKIYLSFTFAWFALMFPFEGFFKICFGLVHIAIAILFFIDIFAAKIEFKFPETSGKRYFMLFLIFSAFALYPLIEYMSGHLYPKILLFGVAPCPTIIFSLALLIGAVPKVGKLIFILLIFPAIFSGLSVPIILGVWADLLLLVSGIYGLIILIKNWKLIGKV
ncbi:MAG: DUF6064 family protein [Elusimicrobiota bacterium]|nr:DUF6064 family protein [Elusimicrobiota bacterium]